jgi:death-on-curing family protein
VGRRVTVRALASESDADLDETLVALWEIGLDVEEPEDIIDRSKLRRARNALGIDTPKAQSRVQYWLDRTGRTRAELTTVLQELGVTLPPRVRVLPKGALRKLRKRFGSEPPSVAHVVDRDKELRCPPITWEPIGLTRDVVYIDEGDVLAVHEALVKDFAEADDPIDPPGVRSADLLSSAVHRPRTSLGVELKYPTVEMAGAALLHSLVLNHPFHNGNKRTGLVALLVFLDRNGLMATCDQGELFRFVLLVAQHGLVPAHCHELADHEVITMAGWIHERSRRVDKRERPIPWHRLRRILRGFDCEFDHSGSVGNRINIYRSVDRRGPFSKSRMQQLSTQVHYGDEGREVDRSTIHKIRRDLELDEVHGVDSKVFYEAEALPDDFIQQYRVLLRRLARL